MLTEFTEVLKPRNALFGVEVFEDADGRFKLENARTLVYELSASWNLILAGTDKAKVESLRLRCDTFGLRIAECVSVDNSWTEEKARNLIWSCDIVFAVPFLKALPAKINPVNRPPANEQQAIDAVCYFSKGFEEFNNSAYLKFLSRY